MWSGAMCNEVMAQDISVQERQTLQITNDGSLQSTGNNNNMNTNSERKRVTFEGPALQTVKQANEMDKGVTPPASSATERHTTSGADFNAIKKEDDQ